MPNWYLYYKNLGMNWFLCRKKKKYFSLQPKLRLCLLYKFFLTIYATWWGDMDYKFYPTACHHFCMHEQIEPNFAPMTINRLNLRMPIRPLIFTVHVYFGLTASEREIVCSFIIWLKNLDSGSDQSNFKGFLK